MHWGGGLRPLSEHERDNPGNPSHRWRSHPNDHRRLVGWQGGEGLVLGLLRDAVDRVAVVRALAMARVESSIAMKHEGRDQARSPQKNWSHEFGQL